MSETMRQEFEAWVQQDSTLPVTRDKYGYTDFTTGLLWHAWQAAKTKAPSGASEGVNRANARPGLAGSDYTCAHDFAVQPSSGIKLCQTCGLSETAARKAALQPGCQPLRTSYPVAGAHMKTCIHCQQSKPLDAFRKSARMIGGRENGCKDAPVIAFLKDDSK